MPWGLKFVVMLAWLGVLAWFALSRMEQAQWFHIGVMLSVWLLLLLALPVLKPEKKRSIFSTKR